MLLDLFGALVVFGVLAACADWRSGFLFAIIVGTLQDPVRKLTPGTPAILAISALPIVVAALLSLFSRDRRVLTRFRMAHGHLAQAMSLFALSLAPAIAVLMVSHGAAAWRVALLGAFGYLAPLLATVAGFSFVRTDRDLRRLLAFYTCYIAAFLIGSLLDFTGRQEDWPALGTWVLGAASLRFTGEGDVIRMISGFFRSPDIMGWHAATLLMVSATLALRRSGARARGWLPVAAWAAFSVLVCGRRKMIMMPVLWGLLVLIHHIHARRGMRGFAAMATVVAAILGGLALAGGDVAIGSEYYAYAATAAEDAPQRLREGTVGAIWGTVLQSGLLGAGIGSASQGMQHLGVGLAQGWQESGASKLVAELGVAGLAFGLLVAVRAVRASLEVLRSSATTAPGYHLVVGLVAMGAANGAAFVVSHQVYGDLLVMTLSAFLLGVSLSAPRWCNPPAPGARPRRVADEPRLA